MKKLNRFVYRIMVSIMAPGFDANFYLEYYKDLTGIKSKRQALRHFVKFGRDEGRFRNRQEFGNSHISTNSEIYRNFDIAAYKFYNKDLINRFHGDEEFFVHYVNHGHGEGRIASFPKNENNTFEYDDRNKWKTVFSVSDFIAFSGNSIKIIPKNREEAIDIFNRNGIDMLCPINTKYRFDPKFVRLNKIINDADGMSDPDLYREWLEKGFNLGLAPNEELFLSAYLGGFPFPMHFNWSDYIASAGLPSTTTRSKALIAFFAEPVRTIVRHIGLMGDDAAWLLDCIGRRALSQGDNSKAVAMFEQSLRLLARAETFCLLGDAHRNLGATDAALEAYHASIKMERAPIWSYLHLITIYADRRQFQDAFDTIYAAAADWRQKVEFGHKLRELIQTFFDHQSARAHALYREGTESGSELVRRSAVDAMLEESLKQIEKLYRDLESLPAPVGSDPEGYIAILANDDLRQCTHYRIEQKIIQLDEAGIPYKVFSHHHSQAFVDSLIGARAAIFYRVAATPSILRAILHAKSMNLNTYYEVDDLIFDSQYYPDPFSSFEGQISAAEYAGLQFGVPLFRYAMSMCKGSIASTPALADKMRAITTSDESIVIRNGLDKRNDFAITMGAQPVRQKDGRVRIFYGSGTKAHNADFNQLVAPALAELMEEFDNIDLVIVGYLKLDEILSPFEDRIITYPFIADIDAYWSVLAGCDINIAVLEKSVVADCKSEIKWLEAAVLQIPSIVSGTETYREIMEVGIEGLIADAVEDWKARIGDLVRDPSLRARMGAAARDKALKDYSINVAEKTLIKTFSRPHSMLKAIAGRRTRILICNVFYAPQSYGGATRVVENNIQVFREKYPDLDIAVFCAIDGASPAGQLSLGSEEGVAVYRLSTPQEMNMDWRPFNEDNRNPFEKVLDHFKPNIIHFHCIQRLTGTIVEVAFQRKIPYLVTLHDAWWISDNQFLVDPNGILQMPTRDILTDCKDSPHGLASITRRQRLASLLQSAEANLSVSQPFAKIYSDAGISNITVVENGTPALKPIPRTPREDGRIALGHIGGRSAHKGASLIEAALRKGAFENLHLTMIDGTLGPGQRLETMWGTTPVTLMAPFAQSRVVDLYSQLNVLLAPSTWPESYGLVTREAMSCGLWVVASRLGAIGQDIIENHNGHLVDVTDISGISEIFLRIDQNPEIYRQNVGTILHKKRSMEMQADEIYDIYMDIIRTQNVISMNGHQQIV